MKRLTARIYGGVQEVGFRAFTCAQAQHLRLLGYVRNCADGSVEVTAEGDESQLKRLLEALSHGPRGARVDYIEVDYSAPTGEYDSFTIRY